MQTHVFRIAKPEKEKKRRIVAGAACNHCRSRKLAGKCDGGRPSCLRCQKRGESDCSYDTQSLEETRSQALRREMTDMKAKLDGIAQTLTALNDLPFDGASRLILDVLNKPDPTASLIDVGVKIQRQSSNLNQQISMLDTMKATFPNTRSNVQFELYLYFPKWYPPLTGDEIEPIAAASRPVDLDESQARRRQYLCSSPHFAPSANLFDDENDAKNGFRIASWNFWIESSCLSFWTNVPVSVGLAERALNAYLRTDHILFGFMDTELFLRSFVERSNRFCSSALVNAALHYGCVKIARYDREAASVVDALEAETENGLRHDDTININKIAALNVHYSCVLFTRPFEQAVKFLDEAIEMSETFYGWNEPSSLFENWRQSSEDEKGVSHVIWSVFNSALYNAHRWENRQPPPLPRLAVPYVDVSSRKIVNLPGSPPTNVDKVACERYIYAAINSNNPHMRESVMLNLSKEPMSDEERASKVASIYRRSLSRSGDLERPRSLHAELFDVAAISQMWAHLWILSLFQPLTHYRGAIPGFQASGGTAGAIFVASARQLQHLVFTYQRFHLLTPPTIALHGPVSVAAIALTQMRRVSDRAGKFEALLWLFADLAVSFRSLSDLMKTLAMTGYHAGLIDAQKIRSIFDRLSDAYKAGGKNSSRGDVISAADASWNRKLVADRKDKSYDTHFSATHVIDEVDEEEDGS